MIFEEEKGNGGKEVKVGVVRRNHWQDVKGEKSL
jgi:hypothetical protein